MTAAGELLKMPCLPDGWIGYLPGFVPMHSAAMTELLLVLPLRDEELTIGGRRVLMPRQVSWHGDPGCSYSYSGRKFNPSPWSPPLERLRDQVTKEVGVRFNSVLVNYYRNGNDSISLHADDEPELGPHAPDDVLVASVSLGGRRRFTMKSNEGDRRLQYDLGHGDLFVMGGAVQKHWKHEIAKTKRRVLPRLSLTFRLIR